MKLHVLHKVSKITAIFINFLLNSIRFSETYRLLDNRDLTQIIGDEMTYNKIQHVIEVTKSQRNGRRPR